MHIFSAAPLGPGFYRRLSDKRLAQVAANAIEAEFLGSDFPRLTDKEVRSASVPTPLVGGQHSPALFRRLLDRLEELLPHAERVELSGASHIMHEDNEPACNAAVRSFLKSHRETLLYHRDQEQERKRHERRSGA